MRYVFRDILLTTPIAFFTASNLLAQPGSIDPTFDPGFANAPIYRVVSRADGRIYVAGGFTQFNGANRQFIARLLSSGLVDQDFYPTPPIGAPGPMVADDSGGVILSFWDGNGYRVARLNASGVMTGSPSANASSSVTDILRLPDGQIFFGGFFNRVNGIDIRYLARIIGGFDTNFVVNIDNPIEAMALTPDGKIVFAGWFSSVNGHSTKSVARIDTNGVVDTTFTCVFFANSVRRIAVQPDGKILIIGPFEAGSEFPWRYIARLNADGSHDTNFKVRFGGPYTFLEWLAIEPAGKILIGGDFTEIDGTPCRGIARLHPNGRLDTSFDSGDAIGRSTFILPQGTNILIAGEFLFDGSYRPTVRRLFGGEVPPAAPAIVTQPTNQAVNAGNNVTFVMRATGSPTLEYQWRFDGSNIAGATRSSLTLNNLQPSHAGTYTVVVSNELGTALSGPAELAVVAFPPSIYRNPTNLTVYAGQDAIFAVAFTAAPPATVQWWFNQNPFSWAPTNLPGGTNPTLYLRNVRASQQGEYFAVVQNSEGENVSDFAMLNVLPALTNAGAVDIGFDPPGDAFWIVQALALQSDGKLLVGGPFVFGTGQPARALVRLNPDGTVDSAFNPVLASFGGPFLGVRALLVQPDGRILVGGSFNVGGFQRSVVRLLPNGDRDTNFTPIALGQVARCFALQREGKIIIASDNISLGTMRLGRLLPDGKVDPSFFGTNLIVAPGNLSSSYSLVVQPDDKLLYVSNLGLRRLLPSGPWDLSFVTTGSVNIVSAPRAVALDSDGKIIVAGGAGQDGAPTTDYLGVARLAINGARDTNFNAGLCNIDALVNAVAVQPDGKIIIGGSFTNIQGVGRRNIARLNRNGTLDTSFNPGAGINGPVLALALRLDGKVVAGGGYFSQVNGFSRTNLVQLLGDQPTAPGIVAQPSSQTINAGQNALFSIAVSGTPAPTFQWQFEGEDIPGASNAALRIINALQSAAGFYHVIISNALGAITSAPVTLTINAAPINPGSLDIGFNPGFGANAPVQAIVAQPDGKLVIGGAFTAIQGVPRNRVARINVDGSLDTTFDVGTGITGWTNPIVNALAREADGKLLVGGSFTNFNGIARTNLLRLDSDGSLDAAFMPAISAVDSNVFALALQSSGKILVGHAGPFGLTRLHPDGSRDTNFARVSNYYGNGRIYALAVRPDDRIIVGGDFPYSQGPMAYLRGLNTNGAFDTYLQEPAGPVHALAVQSDGRILVGGDFIYVLGETTDRSLFRVTASGAFDRTFAVPGVTGIVHSVILDDCGHIYVGGRFTQAFGANRRAFARLDPSGALDTSFADPGPDGTVFALAYQGNSGVALAGEFVSLSGATRECIARLHTEPYSPPTFITPLTNRAAVAGSDIELAVAVPCSPAPQFQWFFNGTLIHDATNSALLLRNVSAPRAGSYSIVVSNALGVITSTPANLTIVRATNTPGALDIGFYPPTNIYSFGFNFIAQSLAVQPNGKVLAGTYSSIHRLNVDGSLDSTFHFDGATSYSFYEIAVQDDGGILAANSSFYRLMRLLPDGRRDTNFLAITNWTVKAIQRLPENKILVAGDRIARLNNNGTADPGFINPGVGSIEAMARQRDGRILIAGNFMRVGATNRTRIARLLENGELDLSFDAEPGPDYTIYTLALQSDGKILVGGAFTMFQGGFSGGNRAKIVRLDPDGRYDPTFSTSAPWYFSEVHALKVLSDDTILMGALPSSPGPPGARPFERWKPNGGVDWSFTPGLGIERRGIDQGRPYIRAIAVHTAGRIYLGGYFNYYNGYPRPGIARIHGNPELKFLQWDGAIAVMSVLTDRGRGYSLQYKNSLTDTNWAEVPESPITGDGFEEFIMDYDAPLTPRFYRIRADSHP